jgi:hypothetical protein
MRRGGTAVADENFWAVKMVNDLVRIDPETAWDVIQHICNKVEDPAVLACLASGPLEDLLVKHGNDFIERVTSEIRDNERFAGVAESVWRNVIPANVWFDFQRALKERK